MAASANQGSRLKVAGLVLCGGRSSRMGRAKATLPFGDETMLGRVVRLLREVVDPIVVVAAPEQSLPPLPRGVLVARDRQEGLGPLAGLAAGLETLVELADRPIDAVYATSCDVPLLAPAFVRRMIDELGEHRIAVPTDGEFHHPLAAVYRVEAAGEMRRLVNENRLRPFFLFERLLTRHVSVESLRGVDPDLRTLMNLNTPEEYAAALQAAGIDSPS